MTKPFSIALPLLISIMIASFMLSSSSLRNDTLTTYKPLFDGQTLVSKNEVFVVGFFNPVNTNSRYVGIWFKEIGPSMPVWVANRNNPFYESPAGFLMVEPRGIRLFNMNKHLVWSSVPLSSIKHPILRILDSGNLVLGDEYANENNGYVWESFSNPVDKLLPGMKLGWNLTSHSNKYLTSWKDHMDPGTGEFRFSIDPPESPQLVLSRRNVLKYRWGPWEGVRFSGSNELKNNSLFDLFFHSDDKEVYYMFEVKDDSTPAMFVATQLGSIDYLAWSNKTKEWITKLKLQSDFCEYKRCGAYGSCYDDEPRCRCLEGFQPNSPLDWDKLDSSEGCKRSYELQCGDGEGFVKFEGMKLPDNSRLARRVQSIEECERRCLRDCSCMAYTYLDVYANGSNVCIVWFGELFDIKDSPKYGDTIFIKVARAQLEALAAASKWKRKKEIIIVFVLTLSIMLVLGISCWRMHLMSKDEGTEDIGGHDRGSIRVNSLCQDDQQENMGGDAELPVYDLHAIAEATNLFASTKIIGKGGFGPVYKGVMRDGKEVAIKRLSQNSSQGLREFGNEVILISKLQHRNLVKILGCCMEGEERMLVYEYMPNRSLDCFIFDEERRAQLPWKKRFNIIIGVARGLVYLHEDSRLRIIHRDLKTSNILLDSEMNPKITDFGLARACGTDDSKNSTMRVVGTRGYMPPEYVSSGQFSVKSDVFSFGVVILEIISGKKNWGFQHADNNYNLIGYAWDLWRKGTPMELIDETLTEEVSSSEEDEEEEQMIRCIQVSLLCAQSGPDERPTMSSVLHMLLRQENGKLPTPHDPGICASGFVASAPTSRRYKGEESSINLINLTTLEVR